MREVQRPYLVVDLVAGLEQGVWEELVELAGKGVGARGVGVQEGHAVCCEGDGG